LDELAASVFRIQELYVKSLRNSEGELSIHVRMQYTFLTVDLKKLRLLCCGLDLGGCGWYPLAREHSNVLSDSARL